MQVVSVVIACHGEAKDLPVILGQLSRQREYTMGRNSRTKEPFYWDAGQPCDLPIEVILSFDGMAPSSVEPGDWPFPVRIIENSKQGGVGHHTRAPGIARAMGDWVVLTNMDNYFIHGWRHRIHPALSWGNGKANGIVYWNVLNNLQRWGTHGGTKFIRGHADLSCCAVRTEIAKQVGFPWKHYDADFDYIEGCLKICRARRMETHYIDETLSVHN